MLNVMKWCCVAVAAPVLLVSTCMVARAEVPAEIIADIWVTKYALTRGIQHEKAKLEAGGKIAFTPTAYYSSSEFELSELQAVNKAEVMRRKEIQSLTRRIDKLNNMKFEVKE